jgi:hypothetical protein
VPAVESVTVPTFFIEPLMVPVYVPKLRFLIQQVSLPAVNESTPAPDPVIVKLGAEALLSLLDS